MFSCFEPSPAEHQRFKRKQEVREENGCCSVSRQLKDMMVRIVHAGGRVEMYHTPFPASQLIQKYPGLCVTTPQVFKNPHESVLTAQSILLPGRKYFLMKCSAVEKLKRRLSTSDEPLLKSQVIENVGDISLEESICSAKDFYIATDTDGDTSLEKSICSAKEKDLFIATETEHQPNLAPKKSRKVKEKRAFVPPIQRSRRIWKQHDWEPSFNSIRELSP